MTKKIKQLQTTDLKDINLWENITKNIKPLYGKDIKKKSSGEDIIFDGKSKKIKNMLPDKSHRKLFKRNNLPDLRPGSFDGMDKRTAQKLQRGQLKLEGRLDLHNMTQKEAQSALINFIDVSFLEDKRTVIVITGKGIKKSGEIGILRQMVPIWLNQEINRNKILAFCESVPKDGGSGAIYLRLKKLR